MRLLEAILEERPSIAAQVLERLGVGISDSGSPPGPSTDGHASK